jgi:hypothetical protein
LFKTSFNNYIEKPKNKDKSNNNYNSNSNINKYRYIANDGILKIMGKAMVYNYTPIPLMVNGFYLLPDQFVTISH